MRQVDVLILGGGLAGLSTAYHLQKKGKSCLVVEKKSRVGGTAGSEVHGDYTFDYTGHLLHLHDSYGKELILDLLKGNQASHSRSAWIHLGGQYARYPFQANTHGLDSAVVSDCVAGFLKTVHWPGRPLPPNPSFKDWSLAHFGPGISKHFMIPYNEKLWRRPLSQMTTEWQGRFVPKPSAVEVLYGALRDQKKFFGYNASFRYPKRGGIQALPDALASRLDPRSVLTGAAVLSVDVKKRLAVIEGLGTVRYERLVNTLPLVDFLDLSGPWTGKTLAARRKLRYNTVWCLNLGVHRQIDAEKHWIYFPEKKYPFYRVGFASNFSKTSQPRGHSSLYIELSRSPETRVNIKDTEAQVLSGLRQAGILRGGDRFPAKAWMPVKCGYVVYDFDRTPAVTSIFQELGRHKIESIGRYGAWKYSFMEEAVLDGKRCADRLL
jgi:protoporphyrinogen oxidase